MHGFPKNICFKNDWRAYQQRVLDALNEHIKDRHLHVVAPPGSGKTVLGLEVAVRLNHPTLILAPTLAIRNQWIQRFCELFLHSDRVPDWISRDIREPKFLTVATYQALHMACQDGKGWEEEKEDELGDQDWENQSVSPVKELPNLAEMIGKLREQAVQTIILDEAHHLKNEWWQTLIKVKKQINPFLVGLTATPPYDVSGLEWARYIELNGAVDVEISVPELITEGDLCPHQDYVHFTLPAPEELKLIEGFRDKISEFFIEIQQDEILIQALENHPIITDPMLRLEWIYGNLSHYTACIIFLFAVGRLNRELHGEIMGVDPNEEIPPLDYQQLEWVLDFYLFKSAEDFLPFETHQKQLIGQLKRLGALEQRQITLTHSRKITQHISSSISKLDGIKTIVSREHGSLGNSLRMVILSDYIRKEYLVNAASNNLKINKLGVIPIFEHIRRQRWTTLKMGVLTGSVVIVPTDVLPKLQAKALMRGWKEIPCAPLPFDPEYALIQQTEQWKHEWVHWVTEVFQEGDIQVLIGTKSLLGEGWDAPAINSLILASFVGSFVLSNQMRGRAIRTQAGNLDKTGNIWHLVCVDPSSPNGGSDWDTLKRRFKTFVGVSFKEEGGIENGIGRLDLPQHLYDPERIGEVNEAMFAQASDRISLKKKWEEALRKGVSLVEEIKVPFPRKSNYPGIKLLYLGKTMGNLAATLASGVALFLGEKIVDFFMYYTDLEYEEELYYFLLLTLLGGVFRFGQQAWKVGKLYLRYRDITKDLQGIAQALLLTLAKEGSIQTPLPQLRVVSGADQSGAVFCHLEGGSSFERTIFIQSLREIVEPIDNPRYVLIRKSKLMRLINQRDFHAVPEMIGKKKNLALFFQKQWMKLVGECELVYTRNVEGRKLVLHSRVQSLAAQLNEDPVERVNKWR